jgi:putative MFS transporter
MARFGAHSRVLADGEEDPTEVIGHGSPGHAPKLWTLGLIGRTAALTTAATAWGFVNFGLLLWLPSDLVAQGYSMGASSRLLAESALFAVPTVFICAFMYSRWSTKWSLAAVIGLTLGGLAWVLLLSAHAGGDPLLPVALLITGSNGLLAILLPYAAECYPLRVRGRATGLVAACTKGGGVCAQALSIAALTPPLGLAAAAIAAPTLLALGLVVRFGVETRGLDLRSLEPDRSGRTS